MPSARSTTRSAFIEAAAPRTTVWAWVIEHGASLVQLLPVPVGRNVERAAARCTAGPRQATRPAAARGGGHPPRPAASHPGGAAPSRSAPAPPRASRPDDASGRPSHRRAGRASRGGAAARAAFSASALAAGRGAAGPRSAAGPARRGRSAAPATAAGRERQQDAGSQHSSRRPRPARKLTADLSHHLLRGAPRLLSGECSSCADGPGSLDFGVLGSPRRRSAFATHAADPRQ